MTKTEKIKKLMMLYDHTLDTVQVIIDQDKRSIGELFVFVGAGDDEIYDLLISRIGILQDIYSLAGQAVQASVKDFYNYTKLPPPY